jgi:hypothetical protein
VNKECEGSTVRRVHFHPTVTEHVEPMTVLSGGRGGAYVRGP